MIIDRYDGPRAPGLACFRPAWHPLPDDRLCEDRQGSLLALRLRSGTSSSFGTTMAAVMRQIEWFRFHSSLVTAARKREDRHAYRDLNYGKRVRHSGHSTLGQASVGISRVLCAR